VSFKDLDDLGNKIDGLDKDLTGLKDDLQNGLDGAKGDLDMLGKDVNKNLDDAKKRLDELEAIGSCSEGEFCTFDGVAKTIAGLADIGKAICEHEANCCNADELAYKYGLVFTDVDSCVKAFSGMLERGIPNDFLQNPATANALAIAHVLNNSKILVSLNKDGIAACAKSLRAQDCDVWTEEGPSDPGCNESTEEEDDPCDVSNLVDGQQPEGAPCGVAGINGLDECIDGTVCKRVDAYTVGPTSAPGLCAKPAVAGDACQYDKDCNTTGYLNGSLSETLYCNAGACDTLGGEGDPCAYIDPTFTIWSENMDPLYSQRSATLVDCADGLWCDPSSLKCVSRCSDGKICKYNSDCLAGSTCNYTEIYALYDDTFSEGICRPALADDEACHENSECEHNRCEPNSDDKLVCVPARAKPGDDCPTSDPGGYDSECEGPDGPDDSGGYCNLDGKCATYCGGSGPKLIIGPSEIRCADGEYCDKNNGPNHCEAKILETKSCGSDAFSDSKDGTCATGFCNDGTCDVTKPNGTTDPANVCGTGMNAQCTDGWCDTSGDVDFCTAFLEAGDTCNVSGRCRPNTTYCSETTTKCVAYGADGDACNNSNDSADCDESANLSCAEMGSSDECHHGGEYPNGADCNACAFDENGGYHCNDNICASGWCPDDTYKCTDPIAEGEDCDTNDGGLDTCAQGTFCNYPANAYGEPDPSYKGTCDAQHTVGQACDPRFDGDDCLNGANCNLRYNVYVCEMNAIPPETVMCMGT
jgi:hypothetical protein